MVRQVMGKPTRWSSWAHAVTVTEWATTHPSRSGLASAVASMLVRAMRDSALSTGRLLAAERRARAWDPSHSCPRRTGKSGPPPHVDEGSLARRRPARGPRVGRLSRP
jgi:hypothetical protein